MSFILDALRKSETERQEQGSAEFANVPTSGERREGPPAWLWVLGALLLVNLLVLVGIMMRPEAQPATPDTGPADSLATTGGEAVQASGDFADRLAAARKAELPHDEPVAVQVPSGYEADVGAASAANGFGPEGPPTEGPPTEGPPTEGPPTARATNTAALPTIHEVRATGLVNVGELHVDIHVFAESASDRFVFINMAKYNEGARLAEGPLVEEITVDGVVLSHDGTTFLVPRD